MMVSPVEANDARAELRRAKTILLSSYKRDGTAVSTPVSLAAENGRLFFRSYDGAWKTKRIRHNPKVEVAPSTLRASQQAIRSPLTPFSSKAKTPRSPRALAREHRVLQGLLVPIAHRLARYRTMHYELPPTEQLRGWDHLLGQGSVREGIDDRRGRKLAANHARRRRLRRTSQGQSTRVRDPRLAVAVGQSSASASGFTVTSE